MIIIKKLGIVIALLGTFVSAQAQEYKTREVPNAPAFSAVEVSGGDVNVYFSQGKGHSFSVSGPAKLVKAIKIKVKESTLFIEYKEPFFTGDDDVAVYVNAPQLNRVAVYGEADFESKNAFQGTELVIKTRQNGEVSMKHANVAQINVDSKGSSSVDLDYVEASNIRVSALDRAEVELAGTTERFEILKKGMLAEIDTKKLVATQTSSSASGVAGQVAKDGSVEFSFNE